MELKLKLRPEIATLGTNAMAEHDRAVAALQERIARRIEHLRRHLTAPAPPLLSMKRDDTTPLTNWLSTLDGGAANLCSTNAAGTNLLCVRIAAGEKPVLAGWEHRLRLAPGRYQVLAAVASSQPVFRGPRSPMALRIVGGEEVQFESTRPDSSHLELSRTIDIRLEEEILVQCSAYSAGDPLDLQLGPVSLRRVD